MKNVNKISFTVVFLLLGAHFIFAQSNFDVYVKDELLVKYKDGAALAAADSVNRQVGALVLEEFADLGWQRVQLPAEASFDKSLAAYRNSAAVESVQPNFYYHLLNTPNDTQFGSLYGMQKISAPLAWDLTTGSAAVVVADIDTGLRYTHEDLAANAWRNPGEIPNNGIDDDGNGFVDDYYGWDFFYNDADPFDDAGGHGTHTAGTIGAVGNNSLGVVGVNWNVKIMAIKIYSPNGGDSTSAMLVNAYNYIRMMKNRGVNIRVTNNSYGGCNEACGYDQATKDALDALGSAGVLNVFAAGNSNQNNDAAPFYPASYSSPSVLAVAASDANDNKASFSSYGATTVDVAAPGVGVLSTFANSDTSYITFSGTSMATPHTAGAAALLSAYNPNLTAASLKATLMNTVDVLPQWSGIVKTGGRINVARAMQNQTVCNFTLDRPSQLVLPQGGTFTVNVTAATNCDYSAVSNAGWVTVTGGNPSSANGTITFNTSANSGASRNAAITIAGQTFIINQVASSPNYEADVQTRGSGDGFIDSDDVQQIRRFSVALDLPYQSNEFQRADSAPRNSFGDGVIDSDDIQQARRYAVGLDAKQNAAGQTSSASLSLDSDFLSPVESIISSVSSKKIENGAIRQGEKVRISPEFRIDNQTADAGRTIVVPIKVTTNGVEAGYTFSLSYDSAKLLNPQIVIGNAGGDVVFNADIPGEIGFSVTSFKDGKIAAGTNLVLVNIVFAVVADAPAGSTAISFTDTTARRKASGDDPNNPIPQPIYTNGIITVGKSAATITGRVATDKGRGLANVRLTLTDGSGQIVQTARSNSFGYYKLINLPTGTNYTISAFLKQYRFGSQKINITQDLDGVDLTAKPGN